MSIIQDLATAAQSDARRELLELLGSLDDIGRLGSLRELYKQRFETSTTWLSSTVSTQVAEVANGMDLLTKVQGTLDSLTDKLKSIESLCAECSRLVEHQDRIQLLSSAATNLGSTVRDTQAIISLPKEAATAEQLLLTEPSRATGKSRAKRKNRRAQQEDNARLEEAFEYITVLDATCNQHRSYLRNKGAQKLPERHLQTLYEYFERVDSVVRKFEDRLFSSFRNLLDVAEESPAQLVQAVRLVELQERIDRHNVGMAFRVPGAGEQAKEGGEQGNKDPSRMSMSLSTVGAAAAGGASTLNATDAAPSGGMFPSEITPAMLSSLPEGVIKSYSKRMLDVINKSVDEKFNPLLVTCGLETMAPHPPQLVHSSASIATNKAPVTSKESSGGVASSAPTPTATSSLPDITAAEVLADAEANLEDLVIAFDAVSPCFPPKYDIFHFLQRTYHRQIERMLHVLGWNAIRLSNSDVLAVFGWIQTYREQMVSLGIEDDQLEVRKWALADINPLLVPRIEEELAATLSAASKTAEAEAKKGGKTKKIDTVAPTTVSLSNVIANPSTYMVDGPELLVSLYLDRTISAMQSWSVNLIETDTTLDPKQDANSGKLTTAGPVDFFRLLNDQVALVEEVDRSILMYRVARAMLSVMTHFQRAQRERIEKTLMPEGAIEHLCAMVNNNLQCYDLSEDWQEYIQEVLEDKYKDQLDIDEVCRGFLETGKVALSALGAIVFSDPGMQGLLSLLYTTADWRQGRVIECLLDTFEDWFGDFARFVDSSFFSRLKETILENCVTALVAALLTKFPSLTEETINRFNFDEQQITDFFMQHVPQKKVNKAMQQLTDLRQMMSGKTTEEITSAYTSLLQSQPGVTPPVVERLLSSRSDLPKKDFQALIKRVQDLFKEKVVDSKIAAVQAHAAAMTARLQAQMQQHAAGSADGDDPNGSSTPPPPVEELPATLQEFAKDPEKALKTLANMAKTKVFQPMFNGDLVNPKQMFGNMTDGLRRLNPMQKK